MSERADIFAEGIDVSEFMPKKRTGPSIEEVRKVAARTDFKSREPDAPEAPKARKRRERRVFRTGRDAQFSCKAHPDVVDEFYAICNERNWVMGETLERAVAALKRELKSL